MANMKYIILLVIATILIAGCKNTNEVPQDLKLATNFAHASYDTYTSGNCNKFYELFSQKIDLLNGTTLTKRKELKYRMCDLMVNRTYDKNATLLMQQQGEIFTATFQTNPEIKFTLGKTKLGWQLFGMSGIIPQSDLSLILSLPEEKI